MPKVRCPIPVDDVRVDGVVVCTKVVVLGGIVAKIITVILLCC